MSFQKALLSGTIKPKRCKTQRELYFLRDKPTPDTIRLTYAMIVGRQVKAMETYVEAEPNERKRTRYTQAQPSVGLENPTFKTVQVLRKNPMQNYHPGLLQITGPDGWPIDPKSDPDLMTELREEIDVQLGSFRDLDHAALAADLTVAAPVVGPRTKR